MPIVLGEVRSAGPAPESTLSAPRAAGPVAVALCGPCRNGAAGRRTVTGSILAALEAGRAYVNVHTPRNPAGEIRAQIPAIPLTITP